LGPRFARRPWGRAGPSLRLARANTMRWRPASGLRPPNGDVVCAALVTEGGEGGHNVTSAPEFRRRPSLCPLAGRTAPAPARRAPFRRFARQTPPLTTVTKRASALDTPPLFIPPRVAQPRHNDFTDAVPGQATPRETTRREPAKRRARESHTRFTFFLTVKQARRKTPARVGSI
jgi:hypothetical protein